MENLYGEHTNPMNKYCNEKNEKPMALDVNVWFIENGSTGYFILFPFKNSNK